MHFILEYIVFIFDINMIILKSILKWFLPKKRKSIDGEICLITGAGRGIGRLLAIEFAKKGAKLILWDLNVAGNEETARMVRDLGGSAYTDKVDVSNKEEVLEAANRARQNAGDVTMLVNNAGIVYGRDFFDLSDEEIMKTLNVNLLASVWTCRAFLPRMMENNKGHVVTIGSTLGKTITRWRPILRIHARALSHPDIKFIFTVTYENPLTELFQKFANADGIMVLSSDGMMSLAQTLLF